MADLPITRQQLAEEAKVLMGYLQHKFGRDVGVTLFVFELGGNNNRDSSNIAYISNADRAGMVDAIKEWLARLEAGLSTDPPGPRAKS